MFPTRKKSILRLSSFSLVRETHFNSTMLSPRKSSSPSKVFKPVRITKAIHIIFRHPLKTTVDGHSENNRVTRPSIFFMIPFVKYVEHPFRGRFPIQCSAHRQPHALLYAGIDERCSIFI